MAVKTKKNTKTLLIVKRLTSDRLLVTPDAAESKTAGGIIIPDNAKETPARGVIVQIATKVTEVKVGDRVLYGKYTGTEVTIEGVNYMLMRQTDVWAILPQ